MAVNVCFCVKLSPNKKSIFGLRMSTQILYLVLFAGFLAAKAAADTDASCADVKNIFEKKGMLLMIDLQEKPNSGKNTTLYLHIYNKIVIKDNNLSDRTLQK